MHFSKRLPGDVDAGGLRKAGREPPGESDMGLGSQESWHLGLGPFSQHHQTPRCLRN